MSIPTLEAIHSSNDEELCALLGKELEARIPVSRSSPAFVAEIQTLPVGLRAMAATYELDVSLTLDDLGWHFGNWHDSALAAETARGLEELGAAELAKAFREAFQLASQYWSELGADGWTHWYPGSPLEQAMEPLNERALSILEGKWNGIFKYWVDYARQHPERLGVVGVDPTAPPIRNSGTSLGNPPSREEPPTSTS